MGVLLCTIAQSGLHPLIQSTTGQAPLWDNNLCVPSAVAQAMPDDNKFCNQLKFNDLEPKPRALPLPESVIGFPQGIKPCQSGSRGTAPGSPESAVTLLPR